MLKFEAVTLRRGPRILFAEADFSLFRGEKVGITGENGSGKSSLMALVRGELQPDAGHFEMPSNLAVAHVSQELEASDRLADLEAPPRSQHQPGAVAQPIDKARAIAGKPHTPMIPVARCDR